MIKDAIEKVVNRIDLTTEEATLVMDMIMSGNATQSQIGAFLAAMRMKGETVGEIVAFTRVMREKAVKVNGGGRVILDTCGTGGDGAHTFNISTVTAFVAAGAGVTVAKHGNRSVSSSCGSADILAELGVSVDIPVERVSAGLQDLGIAFIFAPKFHASMKHAIGPRREMGIRTFFNILGPMTNPAGARRQLLGVYQAELVDTVAQVLAGLGSERAFVVHGSDGLDEITTTGPTKVAEVHDGMVSVRMVIPEDFGLPLASIDDLRAGDMKSNKAMFMNVLEGRGGPARDIVLMNAAFAICAGGKADTPLDGFALAKESIDSGAALKKLEQLKEFTAA